MASLSVRHSGPVRFCRLDEGDHPEAVAVSNHELAHGVERVVQVFEFHSAAEAAAECVPVVEVRVEVEFATRRGAGIAGRGAAPGSEILLDHAPQGVWTADVLGQLPNHDATQATISGVADLGLASSLVIVGNEHVIGRG